MLHNLLWIEDPHFQGCGFLQSMSVLNSQKPRTQKAKNPGSAPAHESQGFRYDRT